MNVQKQCVTCSKSGGILTCNGCERTFCGKHVIEHRQELANQLDRIMQEHDLLQQELDRSSDEHVLLQRINRWEKESTTKIQVAAEAARVDLREMIEKSKKQLSKACNDIADNLRTSREADDFSENDLNRWMKQLEELKLEITSPSSIKLVEDERFAIHLITTREKNTIKNIASNRNESALKYSSNIVTQEKFSKAIGDATLSEGGLLAVYSGLGIGHAYVLGQQLSCQGRQTVRLRIEKSGTPFDIFVGCMSSKPIESEIRVNSPSVSGWFGLNEVYQNGCVNRDPQVHGYESDLIMTNDVLHLTFDCQQRQIELFHERINKRHILPVNVNKAPFPWQLLIALRYTLDSVRILS
jgi:hypothetical protein